MPQVPPSGMLTPNPAAASTANLGEASAAAAKVKQALDILEMALPGLPVESPLHKGVRTAINSLAKDLPKSSATGQGLQDSLMRDMALRKQQMSPMLAAMMQQQGGGAQQPPGMSPGQPAGA